jgi:hypothetical protein
MALMAIALPILPGKTEAWRAWMDELTTRQEEFAASRQNVGVRERTFLQHTPMGDLVIVTLEGDDPGRSFGQLLSATDEFSKWFGEHAMAVHGDLTAGLEAPAPELVADSSRVPQPA